MTQITQISVSRHLRHPRHLRLNFDFLRRAHVDTLALLRARALEVNKAVYTPDRATCEGNIRFMPAHTGDHERADQIEQHTHEIRGYSEDRNEHVLEPVERMVRAESYDGDDASHHVKHESTEVADQRNDHQTLRKLCGEVMAPDTKAVPDVMRQAFEHVVGLGGRAGEIEQ